MERNFKRFGIKSWIDHGWKVKVFDVTKIISPEFWKHVDGKTISFNFEGLKIFNKIDELLFAINNLQNKVIFIDLLNFKSKSNIIRKAAHAHGVIVKVRLGSFPEDKSEKKILELLKLVTNPIISVKKINFLFLKRNRCKIMLRNLILNI